MHLLTVLRQYRLEPKRLRYVHPFVGEEANMVLIEAVKDGGELMRIEPPLIVYRSQGVYTDEVMQIYGYGDEN
jgi:tRNA1(Val) A37 N6-methylase TrmN6